MVGRVGGAGAQRRAEVAAAGCRGVSIAQHRPACAVRHGARRNPFLVPPSPSPQVDGDPYVEPECACGLAFCFKCAGAPHSPCTCKMWEMWEEKVNGDSETRNWLAANTKPCPKCTKPVEKNGGCNLVVCKCGQVRGLHRAGEWADRGLQPGWAEGNALPARASPSEARPLRGAISSHPLNPVVPRPCLPCAALLLAVRPGHRHAAHLDVHRQPQLRALQGRTGRAHVRGGAQPQALHVLL